MNGQQTSQFAFIVVGVALMLLVIFRPQGILGDKRELRFNGLRPPSPAGWPIRPPGAS